MAKKKSKKPIPLAPPPTIKSRRKARVVTTLYHKHSRNRDLALQKNDYVTANKCEEMIKDMGGREEYQRASVCSTRHHSTSKTWVLSVLGKRGWLGGLVVPVTEDDNDKSLRRDVKLLEVGAINTDLIHAASRRRKVNKAKKSDADSMKEESVYRLDVRAIDLRSMHENIEEVDFLKLPFLHSNAELRYDVIVCSMVINCVTIPEDRGKMLSLLFSHLRPGGICFLTLPKLCLVQSRFISKNIFQEMITQCVGFEIEETKETPKVAFFVLKRPDPVLSKERMAKPTSVEGTTETSKKQIIQNWSTLKVVNRGRKFRNTFSVVFEGHKCLLTN